ncbi:MAG TPA: YceI family protein [Puia sp.]|nr:YceI family protein [Puia sp.]
MKPAFLIFLVVITGSALFAQYKPVDQGSTVQFTIANFGFDVGGSFKGLQGTIDFDPQKLENAHVDVSIDAASINTDNSLRDDHLRSENYFDVKNHPRIRMESIKVEGGSKPGVYTMLARLTIKRTTQNVLIPFTATTVAEGYQFTGIFPLKRRDFDVGGFSAISNELHVSLNIIAKK